jgi:hypothetical protein
MNETAQQAHPFPRSVEAFEDVLKRSQDGTIAAFAVIWVDPQGIVGWKWHFGNRPQTDLIGGIECMRYTIISKAMEPLPQPPPIPDPPTDVRQ